MMNKELVQVLHDLINNSEIPIEIKKSNRPDLCDYQFDGAFTLAKIKHQNPYEIGIELTEKLKSNLAIQKMFAKIECVKPGFINIIIDYGGANVAKPLHIGHLRPAIYGESVKKLLKFMNQEVISDVHLGDYGLQIGQVIYGLKTKNIPLEAITLEELSTIYPQISNLCKENLEIKEECARITKELQEYLKVI